MTDDELRSALDGLFAYDTGSRSSGIHDEALRARVINELKLDAEASGPSCIAGVRLTLYVRDMFLSPEALRRGYGLEDVASFIKWLDEEMGVHL